MINRKTTHSPKLACLSILSKNAHSRRPWISLHINREPEGVKISEGHNVDEKLHEKLGPDNISGYNFLSF